MQVAMNIINHVDTWNSPPSIYCKSLISCPDYNTVVENAACILSTLVFCSSNGNNNNIFPKWKTSFLQEYLRIPFLLNVQRSNLNVTSKYRCRHPCTKLNVCERIVSVVDLNV